MFPFARVSRGPARPLKSGVADRGCAPPATARTDALRQRLSRVTSAVARRSRTQQPGVERHRVGSDGRWRCACTLGTAAHRRGRRKAAGLV